ncbi:nifU-like protein 1, chloroplastic [Rhodamnia argentea]|uniref:NifU-like protein 1, chloroplastic n=1 Tax=Rhodamnia argentea TaxID=178133 RepID=A0A8B8QQJ3_9MYRT|nr:nifU-like protein 1, chloroplastic [Rhodamnia argentea]
MLSLASVKFLQIPSPRPSIPSRSHNPAPHLQFPPRPGLLSRNQSPLKTPLRASSSSAPAGSSSSSSSASPPPPPPPPPGLYSAQKFELTAGNVDLVLEDVRPYLIADGGNVDVVSVEDGVVSLRLQGACESCPSSTTTMQMGIERVLKEKFGDAVREICQVYDDEVRETTAEAVNRHLDILRPAIANYGGSVEVLSVEAGGCLVKYMGPESIGSGVKAAIKEKFPDITNVVFTG